MNINIACSVPDCHNPVIGQCTGYKKTCGRYYCRQHSTDTLCADCADQKKSDEHAEAVYQEYLALAEKVSNASKESATVSPDVITFEEFVKKDSKLWQGFLAIGVIGFLAILANSAINHHVLQGVRVGFIWLLLSPAIPFAFSYSGWNSYKFKLIQEQKSKLVSSLVEEIEKEKKGFAEFWNTWAKQRQQEQAEKKKEALMGVLAIVGAIAIGAIASSLNESDYDKTRRAVRDELNHK